MEEITGLLRSWANGDQSALERLVPRVYDEMHRIAEGMMREERPAHTLQATGLVHETYLRLSRLVEPKWREAEHFYAVVAIVMRQILVDHARRRGRLRRGGGEVLLPLEVLGETAGPEADDQLLDLDEALTALERISPRRARLVELKFFAGLSVPEIAESLGVGTATVTRDWRLARAWLTERMKREA